MSRAYRIQITESLNQTVSSQDSICTDLELLGILPQEEMSELLRLELEKRGFEQSNDSGSLVRNNNDGTIIEIDPCEGTVTIRSESSKAVSLETSKSQIGYDDLGPFKKEIEEKLRKEAQTKLKNELKEEENQLQKEATDQLEKSLGDLKQELNQIVNRVTAEALKKKAAQLGSIKEMTEDPQAGTLTIKLEL